MKKSTIILAFIVLALYGLVIVVYPDIVTIMAAVAGIVVALFFFGLLLPRARKPGRLAWLNIMPFYLIFAVMPIVFAVILFIQGKLSVILVILMAFLAFSFFYAFLNIPLAIHHKYQEKKYRKDQ